jgi:hypothetical protein
MADSELTEESEIDLDLEIYKNRISEYFKKLSAHIDSKADRFVRQIEPETNIALYLGTTKRQIMDEIRRCEQFNLDTVSLSTHSKDISALEDEEAQNRLLFSKFCFYIDSDDQRENHIFNDDKALTNEIDQCFRRFFVINCYLSPKELYLFKELLHQSNDTQFYYEDNDFFDVKTDKVILILQILNSFLANGMIIQV